MSTISSTESIVLTWELISSAGFVIMCYLLNRAVGDLYWVMMKKQNGARIYTAKTSIWIFTGGVVTQLAYVLAAALSLVLHKKPLDITVDVFITASLFSTLFAVVIHFRKKRLIELIEKESDGAVHT